jgi:hypothetical protein
MTHSTRKSYKEKYLAAKAGIPDSNDHAEVLSDLSELHSLSELKREELHKLLQEVAEAASDLVGILDSRDGQLGFNVKDVRKPIDANLPMMDGNLIARRTRDILRYAHSRIGMAGLGINDLRHSLQQITTGVSLLKPALVRGRKGVMESYIIGSSPKSDEIDSATNGYGKNPRMKDYEYETDVSDSDEENTEQGRTALVPTSPQRIIKPAGRSPAARRANKESNEIDIA